MTTLTTATGRTYYRKDAKNENEDMPDNEELSDAEDLSDAEMQDPRNMHKLLKTMMREETSDLPE